MSLDPSNWDYESHPDHKRVLPSRATEILISLRTGITSAIGACKDNRPQHEHFFRGLTPPDHDYFAGHYRGENFPALLYYEVGVRGDPSVGVQSRMVLTAMGNFGSEIDQKVAVLLSASKLPVSQLSREDQLIYTVRVACKFFVEFLRIHPYANGNGHMGRFLIFSFLGIFGIWPKMWPLNERPPHPDYCGLITSYRSGDCEPLEIYVFKCVIGKV